MTFEQRAGSPVEIEKLVASHTLQRRTKSAKRKGAFFRSRRSR
jgi:hypothetical protein